MKNFDLYFYHTILRFNKIVLRRLYSELRFKSILFQKETFQIIKAEKVTKKEQSGGISFWDNFELVKKNNPSFIIYAILKIPF